MKKLNEAQVVKQETKIRGFLKRIKYVEKIIKNELTVRIF